MPCFKHLGVLTKNAEPQISNPTVTGSNPVGITIFFNGLKSNFDPFEIIDEVFSDLFNSTYVRPLLVVRAEGVPAAKPVLWIHEYGVVE